MFVCDCCYWSRTFDNVDSVVEMFPMWISRGKKIIFPKSRKSIIC